MVVEMEPKYLRPEIIAKELDVSDKVIKRLIQIGELESIRVGKEYRVLRSAYEEFLKRHTVSREADSAGEDYNEDSRPSR